MSHSTFESLPAYLKKYCCDQDYDNYTYRDHAAWRFIMRQNREFFRKHAVPIYESGLVETGITIDRIPRITEMDAKLQKFGWGAIAVNGFIPPAAFLEFQALGILAIAADMRTVEHVEYTPAPDIVHESAGHAPIIADPEYRDYLKRYAAMARKAIFSSEDINLYEAIRYLSDIKENPDTKPETIALAEERFQAAAKAMTHTSEAAKVGRMAWWTVEYGLVGPIDNPLIYGAGLLSSIGESQNCLSESVRKIPLSLDCVEMSFDITKPQPQLYVARNMQQLTEVLEEFEATLSFRNGGVDGLALAKQSQSVNTVIFESKVEISGQLTEFVVDENDQLEFIKFSGPVQLSHAGKQLLGHGRSRHPEGFSSPIGRWRGLESIPTFQATDHQLKSLGLERGRRAKLKFISGFTVEGTVGGWKRIGDHLAYITWRDCTVTRGSQRYFEPAWGDFDMVLGETVVSVHGGPTSRTDFGEYNVGKGSTRPGRVSPYSNQEITLFELYSRLRTIRNGSSPSANTAAFETASRELQAIAQAAMDNHRSEWLLALELFEVGIQKLNLDPIKTPFMRDMRDSLMDAKKSRPASLQQLIKKGIEIAPVV